MRRMTLVAIVAVTALAALAAGAANSAEVKTSAQAKAQAKSPVQKAVFFAADGMRQDIVARYAAQGLMPTMSDFLKKGTSASGNGLLTQAPPNTGAGWYSLATGAWPGVHGSTNNTFHQTGTDFSRSTSFSSPGVLQADSIASAAERAGRQVAQLDWVAGRQADIAGPTVDFTTFFSNRGVLAAPADPDEQAGAARFGLSYQWPSSRRPAAGAMCPPATRPPRPGRRP